MAHVTIPVAGMSCGGCVSSVQRALTRLEGVTSAEASLEPAQVRVDYDPTQRNFASLVSAIEDAGYEVPGSWRTPSEER